MTRTASTGARSDKRAHPEASRQEVQQFLDRYAEALTEGDGATIATLWQVPAYVLGDADVKAVNSKAEVEQFFSGAKEQYNALGITGTRAEITELHWPTERIAIVQVRWPYLDAQGRELGEENSTYTLRRDDDGELRLHVTVMHGAAQQADQAQH
jgi:hypothetical protein